jgi:Xaa-Pro aminopeptidase
MAIMDTTTMARIKERREEFMRRMGNGVAIFPSASTAVRNNDVDHEYRQETDFYYLTGFEEPNAVAVLAPEHTEHRFVLFVQPKDREREVWTGWRAGEKGAVRDFGADAAYTVSKLDEELPKLVGKAERIFYRFGSDTAFDMRVVAFMRRFLRERQRSGTGPTAVVDPGETLHEMRLIKTEDDLRLLRRAVEISCEGHMAALRALRPGVWEYEIEAVLRYVFRRNGSPRPGYPPIVASGSNATVLHYTTNNRRIEGDDLLLIDAGAEFGYYTGDVTRTYPASGSFSEKQAAVYKIVLEAQMKAIEAVKPGASFIEPHQRAREVLTRGLVELSLLKGEVEKLIEEGDNYKNQPDTPAGYKQFYMHGTSHWLGMDVHDAGRYKDAAGEWRRLEPGMVLTIEPGLYIPEDVDSDFRGIGIRIEDDVLVTESGNEVLSSLVPKTIEEIEGIMLGAHMGE